MPDQGLKDLYIGPALRESLSSRINSKARSAVWKLPEGGNEWLEDAAGF
jgi:hypothetical protein